MATKRPIRRKPASPVQARKRAKDPKAAGARKVAPSRPAASDRAPEASPTPALDVRVTAPHEAGAASAPAGNVSVARKAGKEGKAAKPAKDKSKAPKPPKPPKEGKVVRDSFTMPEGEYAVIQALKKRCLALGFAVKKSELLRVGLAAVQQAPDERLIAMVTALDSVRTGRPPGRKSKHDH